ncbi:putative bifunctional diguanylate cyclase/phosphodiesterase [Longimicrobium sp.]|uniref:putative bifunctional diguanylate cyclase/phosphodiesterase n=1 Tax=Longimicrobium sp. TaxID=2029185 RepID=UPI003B3A001D
MIARAAETAGDTEIRDSVHEALTGSDGVGIAMCDRDLRYVFWNRFMEEMTGLPAADVLGRNALEMHRHARDERMEEVLERVLSGESVSLPDQRYTVPGVRSGWVWVQYRPHRGPDGAVAGIVGIVHDVTERKRAEEENERLAAFPRESPNPVLECDAAGRVVYANPAASRLAAELGARTIERALPGPGHADLVRGALASGAAVRSVEVKVDGRVLSWSYHPHAALGLVHLFGEDVTARRGMEERLRHEALHDALTGLSNRRMLMERLSAALDRGRRRGGGPAVLFMDLDRFKVVNDSLGHPVGDQLLTAVAERLRQCATDADTVARFGGDEFAVLLETGSAEAAMRMADAIQRALAAPLGLDGYEVVTSASIGIAVATAQTDGPEALLRSADAAMYRAKARGPGGCEVYDRAMHAKALARLRTESELRRALGRGEITPHYQPIISLATGRISGVEALARWRHPERGWVPPGEFVGVAEESGAILELGRRVLLQACRDAEAWTQALGGDIGVSVNLSVKQLAQADLVEQVRRTLDETRCDPARLRLEITESVLVENAEGAASTLSRLKELGLRVLMDDFGTGWSSLSALHRLPVDGLKVDRSFVAAMGRDGRAGELVASVVALAHALGLEVVAEGIERPDQLAGLRALGCDAAQGFLFSPAVDAPSLQRLLASDRSW